METNLNKMKNEVLTFLLATFTITFGMGMLMFFVYKHIGKIGASNFATVQMLYPALVAIILTIYYEKGNINKTLMLFYKLYIVLCGLSMMILAIGVFAFPKDLSNVLIVLICIFSVVTFILIAINKDNCFEKISMVLTKNLKSILLLCLTFIGLKIIIALICGIADGNPYNMAKIAKDIIHVVVPLPIIVPLSIVLSFIMFFGEELGWRGFLQLRLQTLFGKKLGVIILGLIWGIWHTPLCFMLYSPSTPIYCVISYVFYCIFLGIFLGFVYMKTGNLWSVIFIHLINNSMVLNASTAYGYIITPKDLIISIVSCAIVFLPFIFTKEYSSNLPVEN